jgi:DNA-binding XRE family transcriptional regulator
MTKEFSKLLLKMRPESQLRSQAIKEQLLSELPSYQFKQARLLSQQMLAQLLDVKQPSISQLEKDVDMYLSTLRPYIQTMGKLLLVFLMVQ